DKEEDGFVRLGLEEKGRRHCRWRSPDDRNWLSFHDRYQLRGQPHPHGLLPRQESFASLHIRTRRASEGSEALPSLARRVRMSFFGARVIVIDSSCVPVSSLI